MRLRKRSPKKSPNQLFAQTEFITSGLEKIATNLLYFCHFQTTAKSKWSPNMLKFAQSGHIGSYLPVKKTYVP
jgi:hypothetical protein